MRVSGRCGYLRLGERRLDSSGGNEVALLVIKRHGFVEGVRGAGGLAGEVEDFGEVGKPVGAGVDLLGALEQLDSFGRAVKGSVEGAIAGEQLRPSAAP